MIIHINVDLFVTRYNVKKTYNETHVKQVLDYVTKYS